MQRYQEQTLNTKLEGNILLICPQVHLRNSRGVFPLGGIIIEHLGLMCLKHKDTGMTFICSVSACWTLPDRVLKNQTYEDEQSRDWHSPDGGSYPWVKEDVVQTMRKNRTEQQVLQNKRRGTLTWRDGGEGGAVGRAGEMRFQVCS